MEKIALITGGSRGLGKNMAERLAQAGHNVIITYNSQKEAADEVVRGIEAAGRKAAALQFDSGVIGSLNNFIELVIHTLQNKFGATKLDFLVNNAGIGKTIAGF